MGGRGGFGHPHRGRRRRHDPPVRRRHLSGRHAGPGPALASDRHGRPPGRARRDRVGDGQRNGGGAGRHRPAVPGNGLLPRPARLDHHRRRPGRSERGLGGIQRGIGAGSGRGRLRRCGRRSAVGAGLRGRLGRPPPGVGGGGGAARLHDLRLHRGAGNRRSGPRPRGGLQRGGHGGDGLNAGRPPGPAGLDRARAGPGAGPERPVRAGIGPAAPAAQSAASSRYASIGGQVQTRFRSP